MHTHACVLIIHLRSLPILFMSAISGAYHFKKCDVVDSMKEICMSINTISRIAPVLKVVLHTTGSI